MKIFESDEFIEKVKNKNHEAIELLVRRYTKIFFSHLRKLGFNAEEADDIIQSTWITIFEVIHKFESRSTLKTFLFGVLYNKVSEYKRKNFRLKNSEELDEVFHHEFDQCFDQRAHWIKNPIDPEKISQSSELMKIIEKCLQFLPIKQKMAFVLKEVDEEESSIVCEQLQISVSNLGVLLFRARNQLRMCVEGSTKENK